MENKKIVKAGYDVMADGYLASKDPHDPTVIAALSALTRDLPAMSKVLDLGCGAGVPATQWLAQHFDVTGVDISPRQLDLARELVPTARFIEADIAAIQFPPESFSLVVAFYSIIHVPREEHPALLRSIYSWLLPGGRFLATWPLTEWEGQEENWEGWGGTMWWSHWGREENLAMLQEAGFIIESEELHSGEEQWLWVVGRKEDELWKQP